MGCVASAPNHDESQSNRASASKKVRPRLSESSHSSSTKNGPGPSFDDEETPKGNLEAISTGTTVADGPGPLARPSVALSAPTPGDGRSLVLIVWDIENVRLPLNTAPGLSPRHVVRYLKRHFIYGPGRTEYRTVAALTERSLNRIRRDHPAFVEQVVPDLTLLLASAVHTKRNADVMLKKELHHFTTEHAHTARVWPRQLTIVLISGDEDFLEPVQGALQAGFNVQLLTHDTASGALLGQGYGSPPGLWSAFLRGASGVRDVVLPYGDEQMHTLLRPRSLVLAGFGPKRGGEAARTLTLRLLRGLASAAATSSASSGGAAAAAIPGQAHPGGGGGLEAAAEAELSLVEPSFGEFSGSCCVVVTPRRATDPAALAAALRRQCAAAGGVSAGGGSPGPRQGQGEARLLVFEARRLLRLVLQADDTWTPTDATVAPAAAAQHANAEPGEADAVDANADATEGAAADRDGDDGAGDPDDVPYNAAAGRGLHDRLSDACERVMALLRSYRLPGIGPSAGPQTPYHSPSRLAAPHQQQQQQLALLCRFSRAPAPGELMYTLLLGAPAATEAADVLAALTHLRSPAPELLRAHGVTLVAECVFAASGAGDADADGGDEEAEEQDGAGAGPVSGGGAAAVAAAAALEDVLGTATELPDGRLRRRLPALPYRPPSFGPPQHVAAPSAEIQPQQPVNAVAAVSGGVASGAATPQSAGGAAEGDAAGSGSDSDGQHGGGGGGGGGKKKKKRKKKKKKKKNKRNAVVPVS